MAIPARGEHYDERRRSALTRLYLAHERLAIGGGTLVGLLLIWEAFGRSGLVDPLFLPAPTPDRAGRLGAEPRSRFLERPCGQRPGICSRLRRRGRGRRSRSGSRSACPGALQYMLGPFVDTLNAVPRVTLLPLIIIWFGIGIWSKVVVVFLGAVIPILINTQSGVKTSEARFMRVARSFSRVAAARSFPASSCPGTVPFIFTGLKYGAGPRAARRRGRRALRRRPPGVGHMIADAGNTLQTDVRVLRRADLHGRGPRGRGVARSCSSAASSDGVRPSRRARRR